MTLRLGIDVGGTFTDTVFLDPETQRFSAVKVSSTPDDQSRGILAGIRQGLAGLARPAQEVAYLAHGTTVGINALLQERDAHHVILLTTAGFGDLLEIRRQKRPDLYDLFVQAPRLLITRRRRYEVTERIDADGAVVQPLDETALQALLDRFDTAPDAVAVCCLFSFLNPIHEQTIRRLLAERFPDAYVSLSCEVAPEFREYERLSTTAVNAYLGPVMQRYLANFARRVTEAGIDCTPYIAQSNGGILSVRQAIETPVRTLASGPSAGVIGALHTARDAGFQDLLTFDMGGTSTDVCLIKQGRPLITVGRTVADQPLRVPMMDVHSIGAGGGSIAWTDAAGALWVGPQSAGAHPGPAAYGAGGSRPTVTDANVVLGRLNPQALLDGALPIRQELARRAVEADVAQPLGLPVEEAAAGVLEVVIASMARALRLISVERGEDPADLALVAYGGAGPLHAPLVAAALGCPTVLVPEQPGMLCGIGLLLSDLRMDFVRSRRMTLAPQCVDDLAAALGELEAQATAWFAQEGLPSDRRRLLRQADVRYRRQNFELPVTLPDGPVTSELVQKTVDAFHREHEKQYDYAMRDAPVELINLRLVAIGTVQQDKSRARAAKSAAELAATPTTHRSVWFGGDFVSTPVYRREALGSDQRLVGPAVVEQYDSTVVVPPGWHGRRDDSGSLILTQQEAH